MSIDFPSTPTVGQVFNPTPRRYRAAAANVWNSDDYSALTRNRLVNGSMIMSQEWGDASAGSTWTPGGSGWPADQWVGVWNYASGAQMLTHGYATDPSEPGYPGRNIVIYTNAARGLTSTAYAFIYQTIEGNRVADFLWGTPQARPAVLRFACMTVAPGLYSCGVQNNSQTKSWYQSFYMPTAEEWYEFVIPIPGCTTGVWATDNTGWGFVHISAAFEYYYMGGTAGVWGDGVFYSDHVFNFAGARDGYFRVSKVGFYLDPFGTGVAPTWVQPNYADEEKDAMRYWYKSRSHRGVWVGANVVGRAAVANPVIMRTAPSLGIAGALQVYDGVTGGGLSSIPTSYATTHNVEFDFYSTNAGHGVYRSGVIYNNTLDSDYVAASARL